MDQTRLKFDMCLCTFCEGSSWKVPKPGLLTVLAIYQVESRVSITHFLKLS